MAKGIPTKLEALSFLAKGSVPGGSTIAAYSMSPATPNYIIVRSADGVSPAVLNVSPGAATGQLVSAVTATSPATTSFPSTFTTGTYAAGATVPFVIGPGLFLSVGVAAGGVMAGVTAWNATITQVDNS